MRFATASSTRTHLLHWGISLRGNRRSETRLGSLVLACVFYSLGIYSQSFSVNGIPPKPSIGETVTDETTGEPLRKAYLRLSLNRAQDRKDSDRKLVAISDAEGNFSFNDLEPGEYAITVQKPGYLAAPVQGLRVGETHSLAGEFVSA